MYMYWIMEYYQEETQKIVMLIFPSDATMNFEDSAQ